MNKLKGGGPAWPSYGWSLADGTPLYASHGIPGMSQLEWLEGQALAGLCTNPDYTEWDSETVANMARDRARALVAARDKKIDDLYHTEDEKQSVLNPRWDEVGKVHDWRNYVPDFVQDDWESLSDADKLQYLRWAQSMSDKEEWD